MKFKKKTLVIIRKFGEPMNWTVSINDKKFLVIHALYSSCTQNTRQLMSKYLNLVDRVRNINHIQVTSFHWATNCHHLNLCHEHWTNFIFHQDSVSFFLKFHSKKYSEEIGCFYDSAMLWNCRNHRIITELFIIMIFTSFM